MPTTAQAVQVFERQYFEEDYYIKAVAHHKKRGYNPVYENAETNLLPQLPFVQECVKGFIPDLAQYRVHHHQQSNG